MSQKSQSGQQSNQSDLLPEVPNSNTQDETQDTLPITYRPRANVQDPPSILHTRRVSLQESPPVSHTRRVSLQESPPVSYTRRVSIQEPLPVSYTRRVSLQEPLPVSYTRRVSLQEPLPVSHTRRVSIQEPLPVSHTRRVSIQEPLPVSHTRRVSIQEPLPVSYTRRVSLQDPPSILHTRRVSLQDPPSILHTRRVSIQEPPPITHTCQVSIQEPPPITQTRRVSIQEMSSLSNSHEANFQDTSSVPCSSNFHTQDAPPGFQTLQFGVQSPSSLITHNQWVNRESVAHVSDTLFPCHLLTTQHLRSSTKGVKLPIRAKVDIPPPITNSPEASINSIESILRTSQEISKNNQFTENTLDSSICDVLPRSFVDTDSSRFQDVRKHRQSQLPLSRRLLHEARKISRQLSLLLSLGGMVILGLISLGQPWMHFQVPLTPPGDPAGPLTIPINTILSVQCTDISCLQEHDYKAYLLDLAWTSFLIASITGSCLCLILINLIFFSSSNFPILDFSIIVISILTGTSIILGVLFYLMQAHEFLQEGMTYTLGRSFYLAWMGVFLFLMTGFFSFLNYINFWSILALQAIWT